MERYIELPYALERDAPPFEGNDIKSPESLSRWVIENHTKKGGKVFDPFAGLGTNMFIAEEMARVPFGMEYDEMKYQWVAGQLENWTQMICDDAFNMSQYDLPKMDLITTCPPFMKKTDRWNPLYGGDPKYASYDKYLKRMASILGKTTGLMKKNTPLILQLDNIADKRGFTPLIRDTSSALNKNFTPTGETVVKWENAPKDYPFTTLLSFKKN